MQEEFKNGHIALIVVLFFAIIIFTRLGFSEVQPWDEGLYAIRAKSVVEFDDAFINQAEYALGGLYSSTYPPLTVWAMAASFEILGQNAFAVRFFSALCSVFAGLMVYLLARKFSSPASSIAACALLIGSLAWNLYSRQGMADVPLMAFILTAFWAAVKVLESNSFKKGLPYALIFALAFAAALMVKIVVSFIPALFVLSAFLYKKKGGKKGLLLAAFFAGIALAAPWHIYMIREYGAEFYNAFLAPHIYSEVEGNTRRLGALYYINQLISGNPFFMISLLYIPIAIALKKISIRAETITEYIRGNVFVLLAGGVLAFSLSVTKLPHYAVYMIPPGVLAILFFAKDYERHINSPRVSWFLISALFIAFSWSFSFALRQHVKSTIGGNITPEGAIYIIASIITITFVFYSDKEFLIKISKYINKVLFILLTALLLRIIFINAITLQGFSFGARAAAENALNKTRGDIVYLYHEQAKADSLNPQLAWYTDCDICGWGGGKSFKPLPLPDGGFDLPALKLHEKSPDRILVYYLPNEEGLAFRNIQFILDRRKLINIYGRYALFGKISRQRSRGASI